MWTHVKDGSKSLFNRITSAGANTYDTFQEFVFGVNIDNELISDNVELSSVKSFKSNRSSKKKSDFVYPENIDTDATYDGIDCSRHVVVTSSTIFRKGPLPIEFLSQSEQNHLSKRACLFEWNDRAKDTSDNDVTFEDPSSKSLLTYFSR